MVKMATYAIYILPYKKHQEVAEIIRWYDMKNLPVCTHGCTYLFHGVHCHFEHQRYSAK